MLKCIITELICCYFFLFQGLNFCLRYKYVMETYQIE